MATSTKSGFDPAPEVVGWVKISHHIGSEPKLSDVPEELVLSSLGLAVAALGYAVARETDTLTLNQLRRHAVVPAASPDVVVDVAQALVNAGLWDLTDDGDFIIGGAAEAILEKRLRIEQASRAGRASGKARREKQDDEIQKPSQEEPWETPF